MGNSDKECNQDKAITFRGYIFIAVWAIAALLLAVSVGYGILTDVNQYKVDGFAAIQSEEHPTNQKIGIYENNNFSGNKSPIDVQVGIFVDHISYLSIKDTYWTVNFDIWFNWSGNSINPG
jgi:hypothetical protein